MTSKNTAEASTVEQDRPIDPRIAAYAKSVKAVEWSLDHDTDELVVTWRGNEYRIPIGFGYADYENVNHDLSDIDQLKAMLSPEAFEPLTTLPLATFHEIIRIYFEVWTGVQDANMGES